jgi:hypothetical protein
MNPQKTTSIKEETSMEEYLHGRRPPWKKISIEDNLKLTQSQQASKVEPELGTTQPQLVFFYS